MFTLRKGQTRIVVVLPALGIALKFPRVRMWLAWGMFVDAWCVYRWKVFVMWWPVDCVDFGWQRPLLGGWVGNLREFWHWIRYRHPLCVPTNFSFFGLVNVQPMVTALNREERGVAWLASGTAVPWSILRKDGHHFDPKHEGNWVRYLGTVRLVDYGSFNTQVILTQYGDALVAELAKRNA